VTIGIVDFQVNNLKSLTSALATAQIEYEVLTDSSHIADFDRLILPGVGSFPAGMRQIINNGWDEALLSAAASETKILGICLGMQLLFEVSSEFNNTNGLGLIEGNVLPLTFQKNLPIPHMGWNDISIISPHPILEGVMSGLDAYFVHSYHVNPTFKEHILAETSYGITFPSIVGKNNVIGVQFHPEKSFPVGLRILKNFEVW
jgi:glutamine amidotransferase